MQKFYSLQETLNSLNPNFEIQPWCYNIIKSLSDIRVNDFRMEYTVTMKIDPSMLVGCSNERYSNKTWLEALANMKKHKPNWLEISKYNKSPLEHIESSIIVVHDMNGELYFLDHHRVLWARVLGIKEISTEVVVF